MKRMMRLISIAAFLSLGLLTPTLVGQNPTPATFPRDMSKPEFHPIVTNACDWRMDKDISTVSGESREDGPYYCGGYIPGYEMSDADARAKAVGMEIWDSAYAYDELWQWSVAATISAIGSGRARLYIVPGCTNPMPKITLDWKPKFKLRATVLLPDAVARLSGVMAGMCAELGAHVQAVGAIEQASGSTPSGTTVQVVIFGVTLDVQLQFQTGNLPNEAAFFGLEHKFAFIPEATCVFMGSTMCYVQADDSWGTRAESRATCFDSKGGLDLDGVCMNCGAHSYIDYGWYQ